MKRQVHILFKGSVQGIGFRWTARKFAESNHLSGWVKNLPDGRVELTVQGDKDKIVNFIINLEEAMAGYIVQKDIDWQSPKQNFHDFEIRF